MKKTTSRRRDAAKWNGSRPDALVEAVDVLKRESRVDQKRLMGYLETICIQNRQIRAFLREQRAQGKEWVEITSQGIFATRTETPGSVSIQALFDVLNR